MWKKTGLNRTGNQPYCCTGETCLRVWDGLGTTMC